MKIQDFDVVQTLMDKLQKSEQLLTVTAEDVTQRQISDKDLSQSEKERIADLLKIFAKERIIATKQELEFYGVYDDIVESKLDDTILKNNNRRFFV